jgi:hypothetical protein
MRQLGKAAGWLSLAILLPTSAGAQDASGLEAAVRARLARDTAVVGVALHDPISGLKLLLQADLRFPVDRKQFAIAPQVSVAGSDFFAADGFFNGVVIVDNFQRAEAGFAYVKRLLRIFLSALSALKSLDKAHDSSLSG